jgi:outer membrane protein TolC
MIISSNSAYADPIDEYVDRLLEHPKINAILAEADSLQEAAAGEMGLPDPMLILGVDNMPVDNPAFDRFLPTAKVFGFRQEIPRYALRAAKAGKQKALSAKQRLIADYSLKRLKAFLITALVERKKVIELESLAQKQLQYYVELEDYLKGRLQAGKSVYWRFSEVDVERTEVEQSLNNLKAERVAINEELIRLVGEVPSIEIFNIRKALWNDNVENIYAVLVAKEDIAVVEQDIRAAKAAFGPNYGVQALYKQREAGNGFAGDDWASLQATISIPLWYSSNQKPKLRAAKAKKLQAEYSYEDVKSAWRRKLLTLAAQRDYAFSNINLLEERMKAIKAIVSSVKRNYEAGSSNLESVLSAQIDELKIASSLAKQRSQHAMLAAEFNSYIVEGNK